MVLVFFHWTRGSTLLPSNLAGAVASSQALDCSQPAPSASHGQVFGLFGSFGVPILEMVSLRCHPPSAGANPTCQLEGAELPRIDDTGRGKAAILLAVKLEEGHATEQGSSVNTLENPGVINDKIVPSQPACQHDMIVTCDSAGESPAPGPTRYRQSPSAPPHPAPLRYRFSHALLVFQVSHRTFLQLTLGGVASLHLKRTLRSGHSPRASTSPTPPRAPFGRCWIRRRKPGGKWYNSYRGISQLPDYNVRLNGGISEGGGWVMWLSGGIRGNVELEPDLKATLY
ncbi:hypothetical protein B0T18DRAFT_169246 [Schizothecium vesticola]|uniref:Uncharacterized protein n=1 Tax=Schizothecium vesticola TaxID=314040 RepID=A0AA40ENU5_9PEZI|nr:hypothetical protein B0T18DRAFT_169246 [Schizothecium vesticola]